MGLKYQRRQLLVDPSFQYRLMTRMGIYLLVYTFVLASIGFLVLLMANFSKGVGLDDLVGEFFGQLVPFLILMVLLLPTLLYDLLKFSNRIAGPLYRCRKVMRDMASGKAVPDFAPRERDFMEEFFRDFNVLIQEWNKRVNAEKNNARIQPLENGCPGAPGNQQASQTPAHSDHVNGIQLPSQVI